MREYILSTLLDENGISGESYYHLCKMENNPLTTEEMESIRAVEGRCYLPEIE